MHGLVYGCPEILNNNNSATPLKILKRINLNQTLPENFLKDLNFTIYGGSWHRERLWNHELELFSRFQQVLFTTKICQKNIFHTFSALVWNFVSSSIWLPYMAWIWAPRFIDGGQPGLLMLALCLLAFLCKMHNFVWKQNTVGAEHFLLFIDLIFAYERQWVCCINPGRDWMIFE